MIARIGRWVTERPYRATALNVLGLSLLLAWVGSPSLFAVVGGIVVILGGGQFLYGAVRCSAVAERRGDLYRLSILWLPGLLACVLAVVALALVATEPPGSALHTLGSALFAAESVLLVLVAADRADGSAELHAGGGD